jgi:NAD+ synthase (glutamine-hydrolysing)
MRICIAQTRIKAAALEENFLAIENAIAQAQSDSADLLVCPEMALPGYFLGDAWERPSFLKQCDDYVLRLAALSGSIPVIFGSVGVDPNARNEDGRVRKYNAAFIAHQGRLLINPVLNLPFWPKTLMPNYREFDDSRHFFDLRKLAAERAVPLSTLLRPVAVPLASGRVVQVGIGICEDAWADDYSQNPYNTMFPKGTKADLLVNISCSPFSLGKRDKRKKLFSLIAQRHDCPVVYVNAVGSQNVAKTIFSFDGDSGVYSTSDFTSVASPFESAVKTIGTVESRSSTTLPKLQTTQSLPRIEEMQLALESGLRFIKDEWKLERIVVGVSGGIDSALSAVLHSRVYGPENVFCINMPSRFNSPLTINAAQKIAQNLGCKFASLGIEESVSLTLRQLDDARKQGMPVPNQMPSLVAENIQARDRGARIVSGLASALGAVFPCNANKSELTVGYSTLYGDHAGYLAPIADLWKQDVYALSKHYNSNIFAAPIIPDETLSVVPSAELSAEQDVGKGQGDPLCYPYHDALFKLWVEEWNRFDFEATLSAWDNGSLKALIGAEAGQHLDKLFKSRDEFIVDLKRWWNAYCRMGAFKRVQAPPVLAVTRRAFGFDHREAIGLFTQR